MSNRLAEIMVGALAWTHGVVVVSIVGDYDDDDDVGNEVAAETAGIAKTKATKTRRATVCKCLFVLFVVWKKDGGEQV